MKKSKQYRPVHFSVETIREAERVFVSKLPADSKVRSRWSATVNSEAWTYESAEEFFADYRRGATSAIFATAETGPGTSTISLQMFSPEHFSVEVDFPSRADIEAVFGVFERDLASATLPTKAAPKAALPAIPTIYIGHGHSPLWRELADHLHHQHDFPIQAYEFGARAGHHIRDVLEKMLSRSSFALLVLTGEDERTDGANLARQNVVHETGLFQGRLGFSRSP